MMDTLRRICSILNKWASSNEVFDKLHNLKKEN